MAAPLGFRRPRTYSDRPRTWIEPLERRRLLSVTVENGIAIVRGTDQPDDVFVTMESIPGTVAIGFGAHNGAVSYMWNGADITGIRIETGAGNDLVRVETRSGASIPMTVLGGAGNDTITGSVGDDSLDGQGGNDLIDGNGGADVLPDDPWNPTARDPDVIYDRFDRPLGTARIVDGTLVVTTGAGDQRILVGDDQEHMGYVGVWIDGEVAYFNRADVRAISVDAGAGDDHVMLRSWGFPLKVPTTLVGGAGDDRLVGLWYKSGWPHDLERFTHDELGPVTLSGGAGDDTLTGSAGPTTLDGGFGTDQFEPRGDDTTTIDPVEPPAAPAENSTPTPDEAEPVDHPDPTPAGGAPAATQVVAAALQPRAVYDDATPWLDKREDDLFAR